MKLKYLRWAVLSLSFLAIAVGLILNTNLGTLSSFGWQALATVCPLGAVESMLATKSIFPRAFIVLLVVVVLILLFGKAFCAWLCPIAPLRSLRAWVAKKLAGTRSAPLASTVGQLEREQRELPREQPNEQLEAQGQAELATAGCGELANTTACTKGCASCASKRARLDSRHVILGGSLLSAFIFGFPVFCLICPIGLIFGTVIVAWQFIGFEDVSLSLLIYPALLVVELVVLRKWCAKFCPLGAAVSLLSLPNRFFKPVVDHTKCLRSQGGNCTMCAEVCSEELDPHYTCSLHECTKCGLCKDSCPVGAIRFAVLPKKNNYLDKIS